MRMLLTIWTWGGNGGRETKVAELKLSTEVKESFVKRRLKPPWWPLQCIYNEHKGALCRRMRRQTSDVGVIQKSSRLGRILCCLRGILGFFFSLPPAKWLFPLSSLLPVSHKRTHSCRSFVCPPAALIHGGRLDFVTECRERRLILSRPKKTHPDNGAPAGPSSSTRPLAA